MALLCLISFFLNKNWRFRLDRSMVSRSSSVISPKPVRTMFFTIDVESIHSRMSS